MEYGEEVAVVEAVARAGALVRRDRRHRPRRGGLTVVNRILIANRGEIALRVLRACRALGIEAVVAYSEADRESLAPMLADEAICIGPADAKRSYLSAPALISAALITGCDAVHPGYGFLSEDDAFADAVRAHDLTFIGPPSHVLERFASKEETRRLLAAHGLPTIPGSGLLLDEAQALEEAERVGYPVLVKPSAGGGGKGMRMVRSPRELAAVLPICRSEARAAFGDDSLYLERWLQDNRHVEVQVAVDRFGHGVHLWERDCSVQRRHQKILEESPSPGDVRRGPPRARRACDQGGRRGRLRERRHARVPRRQRRQRLLHRDQLPDPGGAPGHRDAHRASTSSRLQIRIASGEPLGFTQADVPQRGHAIEFRINAEDPEHDFRPGTGTIERFNAPGGPGVRFDSHAYQGYEVPPFYDSLLGKLIVWGPTREAAIARGRAALSELVIEGVVTNVQIHRALLTSEPFLEGRFTTNLLDRVGSAAFLAAEAPRMSRAGRAPLQRLPRGSRRPCGTLDPDPAWSPSDRRHHRPRARCGTRRRDAVDRRPVLDIGHRGPDPAPLAVPARRPDRRVRARREADRRASRP